MRNFKKFAALIVSLTMVAGSTMTAFATDVTSNTASGSEPEITGAGTEAYVDRNVMKVTLPTTLTGLFDYKVDPDGLINTTKAYGSQTLESVTDTTGVVFKNKVDDTKYSASNYSDPVKVINKSSIPVKIGVSATLTAAQTQPIALTALAKTPDFSATGDDAKALYIGVWPSNDRLTALGASAVTIDNSLLSARDKYEVTVNDSGAYVFAPKDGAEGYPEFSFYLTGAVNKDAADSTWYTEAQDGTRTANTPPTVSVKFTLTAVKDAKDAEILYANDAYWVSKASKADAADGEFGTSIPAAVTVNGKTVSVASGTGVSMTSGYVQIPIKDVALAFGYDSATAAALTDAQKAELVGLVKSVSVTYGTSPAIAYYGEIQ